MKKIEQIYYQYFKDVYRYMLSLCHDTHIAEEVTQETFFKALKSINNFKGECDIKIWLFRIAKNTYLSMSKKKDNPIIVEESHSHEHDIQMIIKEDFYKVHRILHMLKEPYKEVFSLRVFGELTFKTIGQLFGKNENWARVTFYRAKVKIQQKLEENNEQL